MLAKPFIIQEKTRTGDKYTVMSLFGNNKTNGQVGLEVEVEGNMFPKSSDYEEDSENDLIPPMWRYTYDGSLRGNDNAEYVLKKPLKFEEIPSAVDDLWQMFSDYGSVLDDSNRTSVHVHLNVQEFRLNRLCAFSALYFCIEDILTAWCGDHRIGNLFCLRAKDAPAIVSKLRKLIVTNNTRVISKDDGLHYSGFNLQALSKFGSIEIRTLRGAREADVIITWVGILERLYHLSEKYAEDPRTIVEGFSGRPFEEFLKDILGPYTDEVLKNCGMNSSQARDATLEGVRIAQHLCYCRDWGNFPKEAAKPDPFGRSLSTLEQIDNLENQVAVNSYGLSAVAIALQQPSSLNWTHTDFVEQYQNLYTANTVSEPAPPPVVDEHGWLDEAFPEEPIYDGSDYADDWED